MGPGTKTHAGSRPILGPETPRAEIEVRRLTLDCPIESVVAVYSQLDRPVILETVQSSDGHHGYSVFCAEPIREVVATVDSTSEPIDVLQEYVGRYPAARCDSSVARNGCGWMGFLGYDLGFSLERRSFPGKIRRSPVPLMRFHLYDFGVVFDHAEHCWYAVAVDWPEPMRSIRPSVGDRLTGVERRLAGAPVETPMEFRNEDRLQSTKCRAIPGRAEYLRAVGVALDHIRVGDVYQVNLARRFSCAPRATPLEHYGRLRSRSPAPYMAFLSWKVHTLLSASPELFLELRDGEVVTRPIKGTRPRRGDPVEDDRAARDLNRSEKDRAELTMIIDLMRNDLGRVCRFGSIQVSDAGRLERHPTVLHRVATIRGTLTEDRNWADLLRATFPGGSVTGAPKIRAMQIIRDLEPFSRGVYCGSIGRIGLDGSMTMNIAIRTMVQTSRLVHVYGGGGIVADSEPDAELAEIDAKVRAMLAAVGAADGNSDLP